MDKIILGDCLEELKFFEDDSIDFVCTDPPYGYSFMNKDWDKAVPSVEIWQECLRVLKPGAFCCVMSAPRSDVQMHMIMNLEKAGFRVDFTPIYHTYASGFPKSARVNRNPKFCQCALTERNALNKNPEKQTAAHKDMGHASEYNDRYQDGVHSSTYKPSNLPDDYQQYYDSHDEPPHQEQADGLVSAQPQEYAQAHNHSDVLSGDLTDESLHSPYPAQYNDHPANTDSLNPSKSLTSEPNDRHENKEALDGAPIVKDSEQPSSHIQHSSSLSYPYNYCNICGKPEANGAYCGAQFKPAVEVIIMAMKPLSEKTYVDQALKNGKGISWLDDARIPLDSNAHKDMGTFRNAYKQGAKYDSTKGSVAFLGKKTAPNVEAAMKGRFPANLIVSDDVLNDGKITKSKAAMRGLSGRHDPGQGPEHNRLKPYTNTFRGVNDEGSYSRYFSLDKWAQTLPFLIVPKASKSEKGADNTHPTCKPIRLMSYLITLFSREGDTVLDPFCGSGTTCLAAKKLRRQYIGIEREPEYREIAQARLNADKQEQLL